MRPGGLTWSDFDFRPLAEPDGAVRAALVSAAEVTGQVAARREAEEARAALAAVEVRTRFAQEAAGVGTWEWESRTDRLVWSPEQFRLHGLDPGRGGPPPFAEWLSVVREEDRPGLLKAAAEGFTGPAGAAAWPSGSGARPTGPSGG